MPRDEALALYERQTTYVHSVLNYQPKLIEVLNLKEKETFTRYFLPDWMEEGHFVSYYTKIQEEEPVLIERGNRLLVAFMNRNRLTEPDVMPMVYTGHHE